MPAPCGLDFQGKYCHSREVPSVAVLFSEKLLRIRRQVNYLINYENLYLNSILPEAYESCLTFTTSIKTFKSLMK